MLNPRTVYAVRFKGNPLFDLAIMACIKDKQLCYYDFNRGHMLEGRVIRNLKDGIIFKSKARGDITLTPLTLNEFNEQIRPSLVPRLSDMLIDLDDVYSWYRRLANVT